MGVQAMEKFVSEGRRRKEDRRDSAGAPRRNQRAFVLVSTWEQFCGLMRSNGEENGKFRRESFRT